MGAQIIDDEKLFDLGFDQVRHQDEAISAVDTKLGVLLAFTAAAIAEILGLLVLGLIESSARTQFTGAERYTLFGGVIASFAAGIASLIGIGLRGDVRPFSLAGVSGKMFAAFIADLEKDAEARQSEINSKVRYLWFASLMFILATALWTTCTILVVLHLGGSTAHSSPTKSGCVVGDPCSLPAIMPTKSDTKR